MEILILGILLSLFARALWAICNICDKVLRAAYIKNSVTLAVSIGIFHGVIVFSILPLVGFKVPSLKDSTLAIIIGALYISALILYFNAVNIGPPSEIIPLMTLMPVFTLVLEMVFLKKYLVLTQYLGFLLILTGGFLITWEKKLKLKKYTAAIIFTNIIFATQGVLMKFLFMHNSFWHAFLWIRFGLLIVSLIIIPWAKIELLVRAAFSTKLFIIGINMIGFVAMLINNYAIKLIPISIVHVLMGFQVIFVLLYTRIFSWILPNLYKDATEIKKLPQKIVSVLFMLLGLLLISQVNLGEFWKNFFFWSGNNIK
jgi:drug/metabolite transporter (DMT)-like permease